MFHIKTHVQQFKNTALHNDIYIFFNTVCRFQFSPVTKLVYIPYTDNRKIGLTKHNEIIINHKTVLEYIILKRTIFQFDQRHDHVMKVF